MAARYGYHGMGFKLIANHTYILRAVRMRRMSPYCIKVRCVLRTWYSYRQQGYMYDTVECTNSTCTILNRVLCSGQWAP